MLTSATRRTTCAIVVAAVALAATSAWGDEVFSAEEMYTTNATEFSDWETAVFNAGAISISVEDFSSYDGLGADVDIPPGTSLATPSGLSIFYDESVDASSSGRAEIDVINTSWTNDPPFEGSASFEGFAIVPGGLGTGSNLIRFDLPFPVIGFAADFESPASGGDLIAVINGVEEVHFDTVLPSGVDGFVGYVADAPFTSIIWAADDTSTAGEVFDIDNFHFARIPAPGVLGVLGLAGLIHRGRRRRES